MDRVIDLSTLFHNNFKLFFKNRYNANFKTQIKRIKKKWQTRIQRLEKVSNVDGELIPFKLT